MVGWPWWWWSFWLPAKAWAFSSYMAASCSNWTPCWPRWWWSEPWVGAWTGSCPWRKAGCSGGGGRLSYDPDRKRKCRHAAPQAEALPVQVADPAQAQGMGDSRGGIPGVVDRFAVPLAPGKPFRFPPTGGGVQH